MNDDPFEVELQDSELIAEIRLIVASAESAGFLKRSMVDGLVGIDHRPDTSGRTLRVI